jgi:hypothetical protein
VNGVTRFVWHREFVPSESTPSQPLSQAAHAPASSRLVRWSAIITVVAAIVAAVASVSVIRQSSRIDKIEQRIGSGSLQQAAVGADADPHNRHAVLVSADGSTRLNVVLTPSGVGFTTGGEADDAGDGRRFQLWALVGGQHVSLGLLDTDITTAVAFRVPDGASALALSNEPMSGSVVPAQPFLATTTL